MAHIKRCINLAWVSAALAVSAKVAPDYFLTGEQLEGANAFLEKRKPNFRRFRK